MKNYFYKSVLGRNYYLESKLSFWDKYSLVYIDLLNLYVDKEKVYKHKDDSLIIESGLCSDEFNKSLRGLEGNIGNNKMFVSMHDHIQKLEDLIKWMWVRVDEDSEEDDTEDSLEKEQFEEFYTEVESINTLFYNKLENFSLGSLYFENGIDFRADVKLLEWEAMYNVIFGYIPKMEVKKEDYSSKIILDVNVVQVLDNLGFLVEKGDTLFFLLKHRFFKNYSQTSFLSLKKVYDIGLIRNNSMLFRYINLRHIWMYNSKDRFLLAMDLLFYLWKSFIELQKNMLLNKNKNLKYMWYYIYYNEQYLYYYIKHMVCYILNFKLKSYIEQESKLIKGLSLKLDMYWWTTLGPILTNKLAYWYILNIAVRVYYMYIFAVCDINIIKVKNTRLRYTLVNSGLFDVTFFEYLRRFFKYTSLTWSGNNYNLAKMLKNYSLAFWSKYIKELKCSRFNKVSENKLGTLKFIA